MKKTFFIVGIAVLISSCNLGNEGWVLSGNSSFKSLGSGRRMIRSNNAISHKTFIYPDVVSHAYNKDFIIAKQVPEKSNWVDALGGDLYTRYTCYSNYIRNPKILEEDGYRHEKGKIEFDSVNYKMFYAKGATTKNTYTDAQIKNEIADSLIKNDPYYKKIFSSKENYWIIYNPKDTLIGPLTKEEYLIKRKELHIPDDLQLEE